MHTRAHARSGRAALVGLLVALAASGCDDKKQTVSAIDAGADEGGLQGPILDGELSAAVAAASANDGGAASAADGPPPNGVFAAGMADTVQRADAPPKIEVLDEGRDPKATFTPELEPGAEQKVVITVGVRMGPQSAMPTLDFALTLKVDKPKDAKDAPAPAKPLGVTAKVTSVTLGAEQPGALPKELADQVAKLKGSEIRYALTPSGGGRDYTIQLSKDADPGLEQPVRSLQEVASILTVPFPSKPVGAGGYWMATDRSQSLGIDVVRYRVFRVESVEPGGAVNLAMDTREYAAMDTATLPAGGGEPVQLTVGAFEGQGKGKLALAGKSLLPSLAQITQRTGVRLQRGTGPGAQQMGLQTDVTGEIGPPAAAKKKP